MGAAAHARAHVGPRAQQQGDAIVNPEAQLRQCLRRAAAAAATAHLCSGVLERGLHLATARQAQGCRAPPEWGHWRVLHISPRACARPGWPCRVRPVTQTLCPRGCCRPKRHRKFERRGAAPRGVVRRRERRVEPSGGGWLCSCGAEQAAYLTRSGQRGEKRRQGEGWE